MKPIDKEELFENLTHFLKARGIQLREGNYKTGIRTGCNVLADAINFGQEGLAKAKAGVDKKLDQMRQVIHEQTAPRPAANPQPSRKGAAKMQPATRKRRRQKPGLARTKKATRR